MYYLYLKNEEFAHTWVNGGIVPLETASYYRTSDNTRNGVYTPDENIIFETKNGFNKLGAKDILNSVIGGAGAMMVNITINGKIMDSNGNVYAEGITKQYYEDGVILSLSTTLSIELLERFKTKNSVIKIVDIDKLILSLNEQLGIECTHKLCDYTLDDNRNHFLKHIDDSWQSEYRLFWKGIERTDVNIPSGLAINVTKELSKV